jgi:transposase-like protein
MPKAHPKGEKITLDYIARHFSDENEAYLFLEKLRWSGHPVCPHCGSDRAYFLQPRTPDRYTRTGHATQRRVYKCAACRKQFSVLIGTIFEGTKIPIYKWLMAIHLMCANKNGVAAYELHRTLEITNKSAWFMAHRIRKALEREPLVGMLTGVVEADETYIGGRPRRANNSPRLNPKQAAQVRMKNKVPVVSLVQRGGEVRSQVMKKVTGANLGKLLKENVNPRATLMTDGLRFYRKPGTGSARHEAVDHSLGEYVRDDAHINTAEGYFSQLKRSVDGTHHHVSEQHLHRYLGEFDFRYNTRKLEDGQRTILAIQQTEGKRLRYRDPVRAIIESTGDSEGV